MFELIKTAGLELHIRKDSLTKGECWVETVPPGLWCGFRAQGAMATVNEATGLPRRNEHDVGYACNFWLRDQLDIEHIVLETGESSAVFVRIQPDNMEELLGHDFVQTKSPFKSFEINNDKRLIVQSLAWQILGCTLNGSARRLYLTGKAMELISLLINDGACQHDMIDNANSPNSLKSNEIKRLHEAKSILLESLETPPTVIELSQKVGLNSRKLSDGFKELFGTSVYAFVKDRRFDLAHLLLGSGGTTVAEVAYVCGYQPAHFSTAFRKRFGVSPSILLSDRKHSL